VTDEGFDSGAQGSITFVARSYSIAFSDVWDAVLATTRGLRGWEALHSDPRAGTAQLRTVNFFGYRAVEARVALWLDEVGQTRLEIAFAEPRRLLLPSSAPLRARRFLRRLDRALRIAPIV
jgi:hypothetical protein